MSDRAQSIVFGGGPAGLGAAWEFVLQGQGNVLVLELKDRYGGLAGTFERNGFRLDYGPHKFYTRFEYLRERVKALLGPDLLTVPTVSGVWLLGRRFEYPVSVKDLLVGLPPTTALRFGFSYLWTLLRQRIRPRPDVSYEDYLVNRFGRGVYETVFEPLAAKVWGDPARLDAGLARVRVVIPSLWDVLSRALVGDRGKTATSSKAFQYPRQGFIEIWHRVVRQVEQGGGRIALQARPVRVRLEEGRVAAVAYEQAGATHELPAARVVSTIPIASLLSLLDPPPPPEVTEAAKRLRYRAAILLFLVIPKPRLLRDCWVFFPESRYVFNRVSEQKAFSPEMIPADQTVLTVDIASDPAAPPWTWSDEAVAREAVAGLEAAGLLRRDDVIDQFVVRIPSVYPVYDLDYRRNIEVVWAYLDRIPNLISAGRHGYFQHNNSDNALDMGIQAARHLLHDGDAVAWDEARRRFDQYQIVD